MKNVNCKVFTPINVADYMLDMIGYNENLMGKKLLENSCGDGRILVRAVDRYIQDAINRGKSKDTIKEKIIEDIHAFELDKKTYKKCVMNLDRVAQKYELGEIKWNIHNLDYLKNVETELFDYVVGNPPYIKYSDLSIKNRIFVKETFESCSVGKFDYSYAFIEASYRALNNSGKMAYLIPSNTFKNVFGRRLRETIIDNLVAIYDYKQIRLFEEMTSSAIIEIAKNSESKELNYFNVKANKTTIMDKNNFEDKWVFCEDTVQNGDRRFGDYFKVSLSVATLLNEAFVIDEFTESKNCYITKDYKLEKELVRNAFSPKSLAYSKKKKIIYPYKYDENGRLVKFSENEFSQKYPLIEKYLLTYKEKLDKRKSDTNAKWFEYGRSQATSHLNQEKLLMSTIITNHVKVYELKREDIPFSGIYIVPIADLSLHQGKAILESSEFYSYVQNIGINANGHSVRITAKDIQNYHF